MISAALPSMTCRLMMPATHTRRITLLVFAIMLAGCAMVVPPSGVVDSPPKPGDAARAGAPLAGLSPEQQALFDLAREAFLERDTVDGHDGTSSGLGPRFNLDSCAACHAFPALGGSSPPLNRQTIIAHAEGATNIEPLSFVRSDGPTVEARFKWQMDALGRFTTATGKPGSAGRVPDGGVHALYAIAGRTDADRNCRIEQPPFKRAFEQDNVSLRIPTPVFGLGLIEAIDEATINRNAARTVNAMAQAMRSGARKPADYEPAIDAQKVQQQAAMYAMLGINGRPGRGRENLSGNDGTITRLGWKAQNKSLLLFSGEAYNVEQGVTNDLFPNERDQEAMPLPQPCKSTATPEDQAKLEFAASTTSAASTARLEITPADIELFATFMRLLAPPKPACNLATDCAANVRRGSAVFDEIYCSACHVRQLPLGKSAIDAITRQRVAVLYSDLLLHRMGSCPPKPDHMPKCLADGVQQGQAQADEFRTAPLWGVGQRLFFLHDGRAMDLPTAILAHRGPDSEANAVIKRYLALPDKSRQELVDFLRTL